MEADYGPWRERIEALIKERGKSARGVSLAIGRNPAYIQQLITGMRNQKPPGGRVLKAIANELGTSEAYILGEDVVTLSGNGTAPAPTGSGPGLTFTTDERTREYAEIGERVVSMVEERRNILPGPEVRRTGLDMVRLPLVNALSAQDAGILDRQVADWLDVPAWLVEGVGDPVLFVVSGDCLGADNLATGDLVIIDRAITEPYDGEIVAARVDGAETLKHWHHLGDRVELRPSSPGFKAIVVRESDVEIIGVYAGVMRRGARGRRRA